MSFEKEDLYKLSLAEIKLMYRKEMQINRHQLHIASQNQPAIFEKWYSLSEEVLADVKDAEHALILMKAKIELLMWRNYPEFKVGAIKAKVERNKNVATLTRKVNKLKGYYGMLKGAIESGRHRKSMIGALKDLYRDNYWSKTSKGGAPLHKRRHHETSS